MHPLIKNLFSKNIINKFKNFDYSIYLNENRQNNVFDQKFINNFLKENENFNKKFVSKSKNVFFSIILGFILVLIWIVSFLCMGFLYVYKFISNYSDFFIIFNILWVFFSVVLPLILFFSYMKFFVMRFLLNKITNVSTNFIIFCDLFKNNQFQNFDEKTGPYEFQFVLLLKNKKNFLSLPPLDGKRFLRIQGIEQPNLMSSIFLVTNMLLYYFEKANTASA